MRTLIALAVLGVFLACSSDPPGPPNMPNRPPMSSPPAALLAQEAAAVQFDDDFRYDPEGKPDPFRSFVKFSFELDSDTITSPLERFDLSQLIVTGIIWSTNDPRALIQDPAGKGYIVAVGTSVGKNKGKVVAIGDNKILVKETYVDFHDRATTKEVEMLLYETQGGE